MTSFNSHGGLKVLLLASLVALPAAAETIIEDFARDGLNLRWEIVNDSVMGGISDSDLTRVDDGVVRFSGRLSLENNGGFASVRASGRFPDLSTKAAIVIRAKGDGRSYQLRLRTATGWRVPDYSMTFQTRLGEWQTHILPLDDFVAGWRGRTLRDAPPLDPARIRSVGILLGDSKPGGFSLEIDWIKARESNGPKI
jgi:hypothetical protein